MPSLLDLITPHLGGEALDAPLRQLLAAVQTHATTLPATSEVVGTGPGDAVWQAVRGMFPVPSFDAPPFPGDVDVDARSLGGDGWEVGIALPAMNLAVPGLTPGELRALPDGRQAVARVGGAVSLGVGAVRVAVRAPNGTDPAVTMPDVMAAMTPDVVGGGRRRVPRR